MDLIEIISGRIILEFLGASVRFLGYNLWTLSNHNDFRTFSSFWSPSGSNQKKDDNSNRNHMIGVLCLGGFVMLLIVFNT
ncbi:hypothetical protein NU08_2524 [Flavobacterium anhuiense]|uniref:Uncharacterized protein n=1 Tax=Flavobacterium anhuiense TaxID=459526 RepID=A0A444VY85_9FLAO|nr:hypothetical protein [Flavobacterium anhuiense]RYJ38547.1 hypothetical protein NU08_2524 [Flavobacterium anhuiense]